MPAGRDFDLAPDPLDGASAVCHERGDSVGIRLFEGHTVDGFVGSVDEYNLTWVLHVAPWPQDCSLVGHVEVFDSADTSVCAARHSGRDFLLVALSGRNRFAGCTWIVANEAV